MSLDLTHGDLLDCPCGCGKPDLTHWMFSRLYVVCCDNCGALVWRRTEAIAVAAWNRAVQAGMVAA